MASSGVRIDFAKLYINSANCFISDTQPSEFSIFSEGVIIQTTPPPFIENIVE
jgi:hypothetical protein